MYCILAKITDNKQQDLRLVLFFFFMTLYPINIGKWGDENDDGSSWMNK